MVVVGSLGAGLPLGLVWWRVAPLARLVKRDDGVFAVGMSEETAVAADGLFALCAVLVGIVVAVLVAARVRRRLAGLGGLAVGGVLGSVLAWQVGALLGPPSIDSSAAAARVGERFDGPLDLSALGVLLAWPMAATVVYVAMVAGLDAHHQQVAAGQQDADNDQEARQV